jgi:hypothetical protein
MLGLVGAFALAFVTSVAGAAEVKKGVEAKKAACPCACCDAACADCSCGTAVKAGVATKCGDCCSAGACGAETAAKVDVKATAVR